MGMSARACLLPPSRPWPLVALVRQLSMPPPSSPPQMLGITPDLAVAVQHLAAPACNRLSRCSRLSAVASPAPADPLRLASVQNGRVSTHRRPLQSRSSASALPRPFGTTTSQLVVADRAASAAAAAAACDPRHVAAPGIVPHPFPIPRRSRTSAAAASSSAAAAASPLSPASTAERTAVIDGGFVDGQLKCVEVQAPAEGNSSGGSGDGEGRGGSDIIFVGSGTSEGIPRVSCLTDPHRRCKVCWAATLPGNKNRRRNTSLLIRFNGAENDSVRASGDGNGEDSRRGRNILIDAGKFFYHSALRWFPEYDVRHLDAVVITHSHADAIGGLDCLRDWTNNVQDDIPIYAAERDLKVMEKTHYYLVDTSRITPGTAVSRLHFERIDTTPFLVHGLKITPLPVWHGPGYLSFGYRFGNVCYISDVSEIPDETYPLLENCDLLILDALRPDKSSTTHFGLPRALQEVRKIQPKRTLFTGMMHLMDHDSASAELAKLNDTEGLDVALSYDGLRVPVNL